MLFRLPELKKPQSFRRRTHQRGAVCCRRARLRFPSLLLEPRRRARVLGHNRRDLRMRAGSLGRHQSNRPWGRWWRPRGARWPSGGSCAAGWPSSLERGVRTALKSSRPSLQAPWRRLGNRSSRAELDPAVKRTRRQSKRLDAGAACPQSHVGVPSDLFVAVGRANRYESLADPRCRRPARQKRRTGMAASPASDQSARTTPRDHPVHVLPFSTKQTRGPLVRGSRSVEVLPTSALDRVTTQFSH